MNSGFTIPCNNLAWYWAPEHCAGTKRVGATKVFRAQQGSLVQRHGIYTGKDCVQVILAHVHKLHHNPLWKTPNNNITIVISSGTLLPNKRIWKKTRRAFTQLKSEPAFLRAWIVDETKCFQTLIFQAKSLVYWPVIKLDVRGRSSEDFFFFARFLTSSGLIALCLSWGKRQSGPVELQFHTGFRIG